MAPDRWFWGFACAVACEGGIFDAKEPVELNFWHSYSSSTHSPMNRLVDIFNQTEGKEKGITVSATYMASAPELHFALVAAAKKLPGARTLPDMFTAYPKTVLGMGQELLVDWNDPLASGVVAEFVPSFLEEGTLESRLVLLPVAKASSALFVNTTIFDEFSAETGVMYEDLATWEGMFKAARLYNLWSNGKKFFKYDDWLYYALLNTVSLGGQFFEGKTINFADKTFQAVWKELAVSALNGDVCLLDGSGNTAMMTGESLCVIAPTSSVVYASDKVIYPDNTDITLRLKVLPAPVFARGKPLAVQWGTSLGAVFTTPEKARAAAHFAQWLTSVENNVPFAAKTGNFPVKIKAYEESLAAYTGDFPSDNFRATYAAILDTYEKYTFFIPPPFDLLSALEKDFSDKLVNLFRKYSGRVDGQIMESAMFWEGLYLEFQESFD